MNIQQIQKILGWASIINLGLITFTGLMFMFAHDFIYQFQNIFLTMSVETFDTIWFAVLFATKSLVFAFNVVPYFAVRMVAENRNS